MSVIITIILSTILFFIFAEKHFAVNMAIAWLMFGLLEVINIKLYGMTISRRFWIWAKRKERAGERYKVWIVASVIASVGIFFSGHLALGW